MITPPSQPGCTIVTGPARSGKSDRAEQLAAASGRSVVYVATSQIDPADREWADRVDEHRRRRPAEWTTIEAPLDLAEAIAATPIAACVLVDSLGTWVANWLDRDPETWQAACTALAACLFPDPSIDRSSGDRPRPTSPTQTSRQIILVAEETGWGIVPAYASGRLFRDRLGRLVRDLAARADRVELVVAGWAIDLRSIGQAVVNPATPEKMSQT